MNKQIILHKLTKQQKHILYLLYRFRFLNTHHIKQFINHKNPTRIQIWLKDLYDKGYIDRYHTKASFEKNSTPTTYWLVTKAKYILRENDACDPYILNQLYREKGIKLPFRNHCLFLAQLAIKCEKESKKHEEILTYFTQRDISGYMHFPQPLPDAYITRRTKKTKRYFLEVFAEGIPRFAMRARINRYVYCAKSDAWQKQMRVAFPTIYIICPTVFIKKFLEKYIQQKQSESHSQVSFHVRTKQEM